MAEFDIDLNKAMADFKKLDDTVANMLKNAESLVAKLNNTPQVKPLVGANSKILKDVELQAKAITKMYQDMQKQSATLNAVVDKSTKGYIQNTQAMKAQTAEQRLHLTATNEQLSKYERLVALQKMAANHAIDMGLRFGQDSAIFQTAAKRSGDLGNKIAGLEQATGKMTGKMKNGYPAVFSFSQVLREMPNFAISARIGFMSLSNNIPMLVDDFVSLKKTMDDTGKKMLGTKGALKILAKELIGFNGIVILATTLVTLFATGAMDDLIEKFKALFDSTNAATRAQKGYNDAMTDAEGRTGTFRKDLLEVKNVILAVTDGLISFDSKGKANIKTWEEQKDKTDAYSRALNVFNKIADLLPKESIDLIEEKGITQAEKFNRILKETVKYYQQLIMAQAQRQAAEKTATDIIDKENDIREKQVKSISKILGIDEDSVNEDNIETFGRNVEIMLSKIEKKAGVTRDKLTFIFGSGQVNFWQRDASGKPISSTVGTLIINENQEETIKYYTSVKKDLEELASLNKKYQSQISKSMLSFERQDDKKGAGSGSYQRTLQEYDRMLENYNWAKAALKQGIEASKAIMDDETKTFEERLKAESEYYNLKRLLIKTESTKERQDAVSDFTKKTNDDNAKHQKNIESIKKNNEKALKATTEANEKIVELTLDYSKKIQDAKTPEERNALRKQYQKESAELNSHIIDVLGKTKSLTNEESEYLDAMAINRENLSNKIINIGLNENGELKEIFDERKENLQGIYDFEIALRNKLLEATESQLIAEENLNQVMRSLARASQARSDMREGKRIGFADYSQLDASADEIDNFISELNKLEIQLATAVGVQDNYKRSLGGILGLVKSIGGKEDSPMGKFQTDVEALDKQFKDGDLTYQQYSDELKGLALTFLSKNDVISSSERDLMNEIISNNQQIIASEEDVANKKMALALATAREKERLIKQVANMEKKAYADLREGVVNVYDSILEYQDTRTENEINKIDEETEKKGELYDEQLTDLETLRDGQQMTDEEYEERRQVLEQQKQSFEEQQENRKKVLEEQMFERDKNQRMMQLLLETASALGQIQVDKSAYISALTKRNALMGTAGAVSAQASGNAIYLPLMLTTLASKGLALASIAASKYSAYAEGTDSVPRDEYGWVGDGGKNELMVSPTGEIAVSPNYPVLTKLKKGTKIYPDLSAINGIEAESLMRNLNLIIPEKDFDYNIFLSKFDEMIGVVKRQKTIVKIKPSLFDTVGRKGLYS